MGIGQLIDGVEEGKYLAIVFKELDYRGIKSRHLLVLLITPRVVGSTTIEHIAATIATLVLWDSLLVTEAKDADDEG